MSYSPFFFFWFFFLSFFRLPPLLVCVSGIAAALKSDSSIATRMNSIFQYNLSRGDEKRSVILSMKKDAAPGEVYVGTVKDGKKPDVVIDVR